MRRREFITLVGGAAAWPLAAHAQQGTVPVIGFVYPGTPELSTGVVAAFRKGLSEIGFVEGRNVAVEFRFAYNDNTRVAELLADLGEPHRHVDYPAPPLVARRRILSRFGDRLAGYFGSPAGSTKLSAVPVAIGCYFLFLMEKSARPSVAMTRAE